MPPLPLRVTDPPAVDRTVALFTSIPTKFPAVAGLWIFALSVSAPLVVERLVPELTTMFWAVLTLRLELPVKLLVPLKVTAVGD